LKGVDLGFNDIVFDLRLKIVYSLNSSRDRIARLALNMHLWDTPLDSNRTKTATAGSHTLLLICALMKALNLAGEEVPGSAPLTTGNDIEKSTYSLFNRTPYAALREMNTDRPDKTESPYTVDAGHFQLEMDFATLGFDHSKASGSDIKTDTWGIAPVNLKAGLLNNVDLQVVIDTFDEVRTEDRFAKSVVRERGFGGITSRLKINLWGNDGGKTAFALMPFVEFPTSGGRFDEKLIQGGLILPLAVHLPLGWDMGVMTEFDLDHSEDNRDLQGVFINSVTFSHDIAGKLGGYLEFFSETSTEADAPWIGTVDCGLTYGLTANSQLDGGINFGVTEAAPDIQYFIGLSYRF
jgi:hypothetical protein